MEEHDIDSHRETTVTLAEHEVLMTFNCDWMSEAFEDWMASTGKKNFIEWCKKHSHYKKEVQS